MNLYESLKKPFFVLAPLDDVTDTVFRQIVGDCAAPDLYFTEFVNVDGLASAGRDKLMPKLKFGENERPIIAQIWGKEPANYQKITADIVKLGFNGIDINMGCPDKTICKNGCCAALINDRELAEKIIKAVKEGADGKLPVSVKSRIGYSSIDLSWIEFLLSQQLDALYVHGRTRAEMSKVPNHWDVIGEVVKLRDKIAPQTLIIGNGDAKNKKHGHELAEKYGLDGIMIGRGIFDDPFAFSDNSPWGSWTSEQKIELYKKHVKLFADTWQNNERKVVTLNKFCKIYVNGFDGAKEQREKLMQAKTTDELISLLSM